MLKFMAESLADLADGILSFSTEAAKRMDQQGTKRDREYQRGLRDGYKAAADMVRNAVVKGKA